MKFLNFLSVLNSLLFGIFVALLFFLILGGNIAKSQQTNTNVINKEFKVYFEVDNYTANFVSDGISDSPGITQKSRANQLKMIPVPINFTIDPNTTKVIAQGEIEYSAIPDINQPSNKYCSEEEDIEGCFRNVTALSLFSNAISNRITSKDYKILNEDQTQNVFLSFVDSINKLFKSIEKGLSQVLVNSGMVDTGRYSTGLLTAWGDDDFQQFVKISYKGQEKVTLVTQVDVEKTGVNISESLFPTDLSRTVSSENVNFFKRPAISLTFNFSSIKYIGLGDVYDPYTPLTSQNNAKGLFDTIKDGISNYFLKIFKQTNINQIGVKKISHLVPIRAINESNEYMLAYNLIEAVSTHYPNLSPYPNPYGVQEPPEYIVDQSGNLVPNPDYIKWRNYNDLPRRIKQTITFIDMNSEDKSVARNCALQLAEDPNRGCDEFSVEESGFRLGIREKSFPVGLVPYSLSSIFNQMKSTVGGPYINIFAPSLCNVLQIGYKISPGQKYIYRLSTSSKTDEKLRPNAKPQSRNYINNYCIVGGALANFSKVLASQIAYFSPYVSNSNKLPFSKDAMTCDKKEEEVRFSSYYINRNLKYSYMDTSYSYLSMVSFSPSYNDSFKQSDSCNSDPNSKSCYRILANSFYVGKGDDIYHVLGFPSQDFDKIFTYASPEDDVSLVLENKGNVQTPKYLVFTAVKGIDNGASEDRSTLQIILCKLSNSGINSKINLQNCIKVGNKGIWGFVKGASLNKFTFTTEGNQSKIFDVLTIIYEQDGSIKYKFVFIEENDFNNFFVSNEYNLFNVSGGVSISSIQDNQGNLILGYYIRGANKALSDLGILGIKLNSFNLSINQGKVNVSNINSSIVKYTDNLCLTTDICKFYVNDYYLGNKIGIDLSLDSVHVAGLSNGVGFIIQASLSNVGSYKNFWFSYRQIYSNRTDKYDEVSSFRYDRLNDEYYIFTGRSGYFLHLFKSKTLFDLNKDIVQSNGCFDNEKCLYTIQSYFDPDQFITDTTNYYGKDNIDNIVLEEIGWPVVYDFDLKGNGDIVGIYNYNKLSGTLLYSSDIVYSFRGVYSKLNNSDNQVSNVYLPENGSLKAISVKYFNYDNGGLILGRDVLQKPDGTFRETISFNVFNSDGKTLKDFKVIFNGYDIQNRREYVRCLIDFFNYYDDVGDPYQTLSQLLPVPLNVAYFGGNSNNLSDPNYSNQNTGSYCEETWCIPDYFKLADNPAYKVVNVEEVNLIKQYIITRYRSRNPQQLSQAVELICNVAAEKSIPCSLLIAIWVQESSASLDNWAFGCFLEGSQSLKDQANCAANTIYNKYVKEAGSNPINLRNKPISGPSDQSQFASKLKQKPPTASCIAGTLFSYTMQRYTPIDQRINVDNQCNRGLVVRDDAIHGQFCNGDVFKKFKTGPNENDFYYDYPKDLQGNPMWGTAKITRPNLRFVIEAINNYLSNERKIPITNNCFPSSNNGTNTNNNANNITNIDGFELVGESGKSELNLNGWGSSYGAYSIAFVANRLEYGKYVKPNQPFGEGGGQRRFIIVAPGGIFSYNDETGNGLNLPNFILNPPPGTVQGAGWCDMATAIRLAAEKVQGPNGEKIKYERGTPKDLTGQSNSYGTGYGYGGKGDIYHWTHSNTNVVADSFRKILVSPTDNFTKNDNDKFIAIWNTTNTNNDADLLIKNNSQYYLILSVDYNAINRFVSVEWRYAVRKSS